MEENKKKTAKCSNCERFHIFVSSFKALSLFPHSSYKPKPFMSPFRAPRPNHAPEFEAQIFSKWYEVQVLGPQSQNLSSQNRASCLFHKPTDLSHQVRTAIGTLAHTWMQRECISDLFPCDTCSLPCHSNHICDALARCMNGMNE